MLKHKVGRRNYLIFFKRQFAVLCVPSYTCFSCHLITRFATTFGAFLPVVSFCTANSKENKIFRDERKGLEVRGNRFRSAGSNVNNNDKIATSISSEFAPSSYKTNLSSSGCFRKNVSPSGNRKESRIVAAIQWNSKIPQNSILYKGGGRTLDKHSVNTDDSNDKFTNSDSRNSFYNECRSRWLKLLKEVEDNILNFTPSEAVEILYHINRSDFVKNENLMIDLFEVVFTNYNVQKHEHERKEMPTEGKERVRPSITTPVSLLSGILLHRLLRVMCMNQDLIRREWLYKISEELTKKNEHIDINELQLILDDLCIVYDCKLYPLFMAFCQTIKRKHMYIKDIRQTVFFLHAFAKADFTFLCTDELMNIFIDKIQNSINNNNVNRALNFDLFALTIRSFANLRYLPSSHLLNSIVTLSKQCFLEQLKKDTVCLKHVSWLCDALCRFGIVNELKFYLNFLLERENEFSCLEVSDVALMANGVQNILTVMLYKCFSPDDYRRSEFSDVFSWTDLPCSISALGDNSLTCSSLDTAVGIFPCREAGNFTWLLNNASSALSELRDLYVKMTSVCIDICRRKIYDFQPPYRSIIFELLTRICAFNANPCPILTYLPFGRCSMLISHSNNNNAADNEGRKETAKHFYDRCLYYSLDDVEEEIHELLSCDNRKGALDENKKRTRSEKSLTIHIKDIMIACDSNSNSFFTIKSPSASVLQSELSSSSPSDSCFPNSSVSSSSSLPVSSSSSSLSVSSSSSSLSVSSSSSSLSVSSSSRTPQLSSSFTTSFFSSLPPLCTIFSISIHALYYRMAALSCQVLCIMIEGLIRIAFHKREKTAFQAIQTKSMNEATCILPHHKFLLHERPLSWIIGREVLRKENELNGDEILRLFILLVQLDAIHLHKTLIVTLLYRIMNHHNSSKYSEMQINYLKFAMAIRKYQKGSQREDLPTDIQNFLKKL